MVQTAITQVIRSLEDIEKTFGAVRSNDRNFFTEWRTDLPNLSETEQPALDLLRDRFRYQRKMGPVATPQIKYGFSNTFSMLSDQNQMQNVLQVLNRIGAIVTLG